MNKQIGKSLLTLETLGLVAMSLQVQKVGALYILSLPFDPLQPSPPLLKLHQFMLILLIAVERSGSSYLPP